MEAKTQTPTLKEATIIERVARIVSNVRVNNPDYTNLAAELDPAIPFDVFGVVLLRHDRLAVRVTVCQREELRWAAQYHQHPYNDSMLEQLSLHPAIHVMNYPDGLDGPHASCGDALSGSYQLRSTFIAPLMEGERVFGSLELGSMDEHVYDDESQQRLIEAVVRVVATAIHGAQVGGSAEIQDRQRQALKDVSSALTSEMDLPAILHQIVEGVAHALNVSSAIVMFDQRTAGIRLEAQAGMEAEKLRNIVERRKIDGDKNIIIRTLQRREPYVSNDIGADERFPESKAFASELGIHSIFSYPLIAGATIYGALLLCSPEPGGFTPLKSDILSLFASQATIAIHNGLLIASAHQRARFQEAIEQLEQAQRHHLDDKELLAGIIEQSRQTFGVSLSSLLQFISENMLTLSERDLHDTLYSARQESLPFVEDIGVVRADERYRPVFSSAKPKKANETTLNDQEESIAFLTRTAETALTRAQEFSELSQALSQVKLTGKHAKDALFAVDLTGLCIYMNTAAEVYCGMHLNTTTGIPIEIAFAEVFPRVRNIDETLSFFQGFKKQMAYTQELRWVLALEPLQGWDEEGKSVPTFAESSAASASDLTNTVYTTARRSRKSLLPDTVPTDSYYQSIAFPLYSLEGRLIANVLQIHDITEQVRDEKNKAALLSSVSHELRTPLTTIKAAVTGLLQTDIDFDEETRRELLEEVNAETDHLAVLVNAIVEMSRIEMGVLILDKTWCDVVEILDGALTRLERETGRDVRAIRLDIAPNASQQIYADPVQIGHVFTHLLENALQFSPDGAEIVVRVELLPGQSGVSKPQFVQVKVIDQGVGVLPEERERVFKSFYGGSVYGMGLGLAISRGIIEAHQGKISVEDAPGNRGCCFTFTLPVFQHAASSSFSENSPVHTSWQTPLASTMEIPREREQEGSAVPVAISSLLQPTEGQL